MKNQELWNRIQNFRLDKPEVDFSFSQRLARDNNWSKKYADKVILEYKKFIYLCCISNHPVTPSDAVDQAWHLHLTYTKSYWTDLCQNTIDKAIHHNPTEGGDSEKSKFSEYYNKTFALYEEEFQMSVPKDIWWDNKKRFKEINYKRINLNQYWLIQKPNNTLISSIKVAALLCPLIILFVQAEGSGFPYIFVALIILAVLFKYIKGDKDDNTLDCDSGCSGCDGCGGCGD